MCVVPNFVGANSNSAIGKWTTAAFTGTITYAGTTPFPVAWQSLTAGASVLCTSDVTIAAVVPSP
jgi:hypothetical protein